MELETRHKLPVLELKAAATKQWDMAREGGKRGGKHRHHHALVLQLQGQTWKGRREMGAAFQQQAEALETRRSHVPGASCGKQPRPGCLPPDKAVSSSNITHSTHSSAKILTESPETRIQKHEVPGTAATQRGEPRAQARSTSSAASQWCILALLRKLSEVYTHIRSSKRCVTKTETALYQKLSWNRECEPEQQGDRTGQ